jgi:hypothetical protein
MEVPMRRLVLLAALVLPFVAPASVAAGGCPTDPGGLVDKDTYRIGELIQFFDSYTDFGDPGTTTIHFERPADGAVLDYTATNIADGTWFLDLRLDSTSFIGRWDVTVTVDQTSGIDTCTDTVTIRARNAPDTARDSATATPEEALGPIGTVALVTVGALAGMALNLRRRAVHAR